MKTLNQLSIALITCIMTVPAMAATVSLVPYTTTAENGDVFAVDLVLSAADAPGSLPGAFSGTVLVNFGSNASYAGFSYAVPAAALGGPPVVGTDTVELGFETAHDTGVIGTFMFSATGAAGDIIVLNIEDGVPFLGSFFNDEPTVVAFTPEFVGASIATVPVPAAAWMMIGALGALGGVARRRA